MDTTAGERVVGEIKAAGGKAVFIAADVRSSEQVEALYAGAEEGVRSRERALQQRGDVAR